MFDYVIIVDYYSLWPEIYKLRTADSQNVIEATKEAFSRHGIAEEVISDNGTQYSSYKYKDFSNHWQFKHTTSSPHYPRCHGLAEITVKAVKHLLKKCSRSNENILKGLLILRNTPLKCGKSPAQLQGHALRDNIQKYATNHSSKPGRDLRRERAEAKYYHNRKLPQFQPRGFKNGQMFAIQEEQTKEWTRRGKIVREVAPRSYEVAVENGHILRRNQRYLR